LGGVTDAERGAVHVLEEAVVAHVARLARHVCVLADAARTPPLDAALVAARDATAGGLPALARYVFF
jgi:hypothetical protein